MAFEGGRIYFEKCCDTALLSCDGSSTAGECGSSWQVQKVTMGETLEDVDNIIGNTDQMWRNETETERDQMH